MYSLQVLLEFQPCFHLSVQGIADIRVFGLLQNWLFPMFLPVFIQDVIHLASFSPCMGLELPKDPRMLRRLPVTALVPHVYINLCECAASVKYLQTDSATT